MIQGALSLQLPCKTLVDKVPPPLCLTRHLGSHVDHSSDTVNLIKMIHWWFHVNCYVSFYSTARTP